MKPAIRVATTDDYKTPIILMDVNICTCTLIRPTHLVHRLILYITTEFNYCLPINISLLFRPFALQFAF